MQESSHDPDTKSSFSIEDSEETSTNEQSFNGKKKRLSVVGATISKIKSFDDDIKKIVKKGKSFTDEPKRRKKRDSKSNITDKSNSDNAIILNTTNSNNSRSNSKENLETSFKYDYVETKDDFLGESPSISPQNSSRANSRDDIDEETAAARRAKFLQRSMKRSDSSFDGGLIAVEPDLSDPHASKISGSNKKFHKRFKLPEEVVIEDYLCALLLRGALLAQGSMYITQNYVCFYANIFGKKTRVVVPFPEIISVRKCKILKSIPNSIEIHTLEKKYFWASFLHREDAFQLIDKRWRLIRKKIGSPVIDEVRPFDENDNTIEWGVDSKTDLGFDWREDNDDNSFIQIDELNDDKDQDPFPPLSPVCCHQIERKESVTANAPKYSEVFPISVQDFYLNFLSDSSDTFWTEFHSRDGYSSFSMTPWSASIEGCCQERHTEFKAPIKMSLVPKQTRVTQKQRCRFISPDVIIFETSSHSRDVPYSNQFLVDAVWHISNLPDGSGCELTTSIFVRFIKKNWLKSMIEKNAIDGTRDWFENWICSALAVATHMKRNSSVPHSLRASTKEILQSSVNHVHSTREVPPVEEKKFSKLILRNYNLTPNGEWFKLSFIILFLLTISLLGISIYLYLQNQNIQNNIDEINDKYELEHNNYLFLKNVINLLSGDNVNTNEFYENINFHFDTVEGKNDLTNLQSLLGAEHDNVLNELTEAIHKRDEL